MPPLDAALALAEVAHRAGPVADDLHFEVPGARDQLLDIYVTVAEGLQRLRLTTGVGLLDLLGVKHRPHATAATSGHRLDHHRTTGAQ